MGCVPSCFRPARDDDDQDRTSFLGCVAGPIYTVLSRRRALQRPISYEGFLSFSDKAAIKLFEESQFLRRRNKSPIACPSEEEEEEDVCPTCFDEYTLENPRITMQCAHDFHLSCIFEWMERSDFCPICKRAMLFDETK